MIRNFFKEILGDILVVWVGLPIAVFACALIFAALRVARFPEALQILIPTILLTIFIVILVLARFNGAFAKFIDRERVDNTYTDILRAQPAMRDMPIRQKTQRLKTGDHGFEFTSRFLYVRMDNKEVEVDVDFKLAAMHLRLGWKAAFTLAVTAVAVIPLYPKLISLLLQFINSLGA